MLNLGGVSDCHVFLFGDLAYSFDEDLRQLLHCKSHGALQNFFEQLNQALRTEIATLPSDEQEWLPRFTTLVDLMANLPGTVAECALKSALLCAYQIGRVIYADASLNEANNILVGACTGSFAAVAIASSRTVGELIYAGVEAALVAFRTGWHSLNLQRDIDPNAQSSESWSMVVGLNELKALEVIRIFNAESTLSISSKPYISTITPNSVTISGPPRVLEYLRGSFALKTREISIFSPYHAPHLNGPADVENVLGQAGKRRTKDFKLSKPLLWASVGHMADDTDFRSLLRHAVEDVLCRQIRWDLLCSNLALDLSMHRELGSCCVYPVASKAASLVCNTLRKSTSISINMSEKLSCGIGEAEGQHPSGKFATSKIAIVGFSGRYPEAASNEALWEILKAARDCHREIPPDRFDWKAHHDPTGKKKNHTRVKYGCFINDPGLFDARFFNLSPREAENTDPAQRLVLMSAYEAIEMAGLVPDRTPSSMRDRVGVFYGVTSDDWREVNSGQDVDTYFIPGGNRAFVPGRVSYFFRFSGPSISVDTACSSSFAAIATACKYLWQGECDTAVSGGANILTNPDNFVGLDRGHFLSTTGNCNPFDNSASGYCRADAVGSVVLKRLEDAIADGDPIFGVIADASTNHCGQTVSITRPDERDQLALFRRMLRNTNTDPSHVGYVEMHGTGTQAGDAAEMRSVLSAFAPSVGSRALPLYLGAVKGNVGHSESASGVTALIKVLMMMQRSEIPPHRLNGELNKNYPSDMKERNVHIAFKATPWRREQAVNGSRMAFLNNFSAAGGNTALLLEDAPRREEEVKEVGEDDGEQQPRSFPVAVSAKTPKAFAENAAALLRYLDNNPDVSLPSLSYTTTARRTHYTHRVLVHGPDVTTVKAALQRHVGAGETPKPVATKPQRPALAFTGQSTLYTAIGRHLFRHLSTFRADLLRLDHLAQGQGFSSFLPLVLQEGQIDSDSADPVVTQLAQCCVQMALSHVWKSWLGEPSAVVGHSLGEYAALYAAGVLSASDAIYLVGSRARLLVQCCTKSTHSMLAIKASLDKVRPNIVDAQATVACINSPTSVVASGPKDVIAGLAESLKEAGIGSVVLDVPFAFHSAQIDPILAKFESIAKAAHFRRPKVPYLSPLRSRVITQADVHDVLDASYLVRAARECVNFQGAIEAGLEERQISTTTLWLEVGIHPACSGMLKQTIGSNTITAPTLKKDADSWAVTLSALQVLYQSGANIRWNEVYRGIDRDLRVLPVPFYQWDVKNYWIQYRNNFCLTKGDRPALLTRTSSVAATEATFISSSIHRVVEKTHGVNKSSIVTESDLLEPLLGSIVTGHKVNTAQLCPSSLYADMALTVVKHMMEANKTFRDKVGLDCGDMHVQRPLIVAKDATFLRLRVAADATWANGYVSLRFYTVNSDGKKLADHASCKVKITREQDWLKEWYRQSYFVKTRVGLLEQAVDSGEAHKLKRGLAYKLFSSLVDYSPQYRGMDRVILDSEALEATAQVTFQVGHDGFENNPCWIDSLGHIAGFIMNGNDNVHSASQVFVNHGWDSMRCAKPLQTGKTYTTYNRMQLDKGTMYVGDTYVFDNDQIIAVYGGVKFQGVDRSVLDQLLPGNAKAVASKTKVAAPKKEIAPASKPTKPKAESMPKAAPKNNTGNGPAKRVLGIRKIVAEEVQLSIDELDTSADFNELGVDSLLGLTIAGRLQDELGIEISASAFAEHCTVDQLVAFIGVDNASEGDEGAESTESASEADFSGSSTPQIQEEDNETDATSVAPSEGDHSKAHTSGKHSAEVVAKIVRKVIAEETGTPEEEITNDAAFQDMGVDSLLSLNINSVLAEQLEGDIPSSMFADCNTLGEFLASLARAGLVHADAKSSPAVERKPESELKKASEPATSGKAQSPSPLRHISSAESSAESSDSESRSRSPLQQGIKTPPSSYPPSRSDSVSSMRSESQSLSETSDITTAAARPHATSIHLQGSKKVAKKTLFMFPDGAGSATSYAFLPNISSDVLVYGLNCPWLKSPQDLKCTLEHYVAKFLIEIRRRQPNGPYYFGGASAGGILAYEAAQQLEGVGEKVETLVLLDSPDPVGLENPNQRMYDFLDSMGMFGMVGKKAPSWLRPHFDAFLVLLDNYNVIPFVGPKAPKTHIIYAKDGMCKNDDDPRPELREDDPREMRWLINNRTDFSGAGWNKLVGSENIHTTALDNVNHYTILQEGPGVAKVSKLIAKALGT